MYTLLQINPRAAHAMGGDAEMDARNDLIYATTEPALYCEPPPTTRELHGFGFYANQFPQSVQAPTPEDIRPLLGRTTIPTLVIKGSCDYLSWASGLEYSEAFASGPAQLVYLSGAGHNVWEEKPLETEANINAFLRGEPPPDAYLGETVPADYEMGY